MEDDPDVEKEKEDELGGEDESEYKETSNTVEDKVDAEGQMKESLKKVMKEKAKNLAEMKIDSATESQASEAKSSQTQINLSRLNEIENQIRMITQLIPQIKDKCKRSSLVAEIAPILEEALEKFMDELSQEEQKDDKKATSEAEEPKESEGEEEEPAAPKPQPKKKKP